MPGAQTAFDVIILGGGIVGCACARECALAGMKVAIVEPHAIGGATTAAGMGHIVVMDDSPAQLALTNYSRSLWMEIVPELPAFVEYESRGTVWVAADEKDMAEVYAKQKTYAEAGVNSEILGVEALARAEPNLRDGLAGGLLVPDDGVTDPPAAAEYFLREALSRQAILLQRHEATSIGDGAVTLSNGCVYHAPQIVVATGTDVRLVPSIKIQKRKGHLLITDRYPGFTHHQLVELGYLKSAHKLLEDSVAFNIQPRRAGHLLIGSSRQYGIEDAAVEEHMLIRMLDRACAYMPSLRTLFVTGAWTGFRAATQDKLPLIGPTEDSSIFLAMGFEGLGTTDAPGSARLLVDQLLDRPSAIDASPYLPARLSSQELPAEITHG